VQADCTVHRDSETRGSKGKFVNWTRHSLPRLVCVNVRASRRVVLWMRTASATD
jgi:hypothetical protein